MLLTNILFYLLPAVFFTPFCRSDENSPAFLICYAKLDPAQIKGYQTLIVEPKHYLPSNVRVFKKHNKQVLAYISLGEVNSNADHYSKVSPYTVGKNELWDSHYLNLESPETVKILLDVIADLFASGYDGLFLDNIDNFSQYGPQKEQSGALVQMIKTIKSKYPSKKLMQNAGLELLPKTEDFISAIAIESVASHYDFKLKEYQLSDTDRWNERSTNVLNIKKWFHKPILLIEYADTKELLQDIQQRVSALDCDLFIGPIELQHLPNITSN